MPGYFGRANRGVAQDVHGQISQDERLDMATSLPVRVKSVDYAKNEVELEVLWKPRMAGKEVDFPNLLEVPIQSSRGGGFAVTVPVKAGDYGVAKFGQRDLDAWYQSGEAQPANTQRFNSYSDAIFEPGLHPQNKAMANYDGDNVFIGTDDHKNGLRVTPSGTVAIEGAGESLMAILSELLDALSQDQLQINHGSSSGSGHQLQLRAKYAELLGRLNTMKFR